MDREQPEAMEPEPAPAAAESKPKEQTLIATLEDQPPADAQALVDRLAAAGNWPAPILLEQIRDAGEAAVEPLVAILRSRPQSGRATPPLAHSIELLGLIGSPAAVPELVQVARSCRYEPSHRAAHALGRLGAAGFDALLELCRDPSITGDHRSAVVCGAGCAAGDDPALRARLSEVLRPILEALVARAREERTRQDRRETDPDQQETLDDQESDELGAGAGEDANEADLLDEGYDVEEDLEEPAADLDDFLDEEPELGEDALEDDDDWMSYDDADDDDEDFAPTIDEEINLLIDDLAGLADPASRELIATVFREKLTDPDFIDEEAVEKMYAQGGAVQEHPDWLSAYRADYEQHIDWLDRKRRWQEPRAPRSIVHEQPHAAPDTEPAPGIASAVAPIRNTGPKLGRNDPCWCGSGKKYKKCHWGKDKPD
jgi:hypothetical protein